MSGPRGVEGVLYVVLEGRAGSYAWSYGGVGDLMSGPRGGGGGLMSGPSRAEGVS